MGSNKWGPNIWFFFHTLAEKIKEDQFEQYKYQLVGVIKNICRALPCPDCSQHATTFWRKVNENGIRNKNDLRNLLFIFHNKVNLRTNKPLYPKEKLDIYKSNNVITAYNYFIKVYHTKGNMKLIGDSFQRNLIMKDTKEWLMKNIHLFDK